MLMSVVFKWKFSSQILSLFLKYAHHYYNTSFTSVNGIKNFVVFLSA